jgi:hypothetical protein
MNRTVFIITTYGSKDENTETLDFITWALSKETESFLKKYDLSPLPYVMGKVYYDEKKGKGRAIRDALDELKQKHLESGDDIFVYMDGNQIEFGDSLEMVKMIMEGVSPFVAACRINGMGIDVPRGISERFENFLLSHAHGVPWLPDAQCGCWAFRGDYLDEIISTFQSNEFEIELELMNFFLGKRILPAYVGMDVGDPENTGFLRKHSEIKIIALSNWLKIAKEELIRLAKEFQQACGMNLPLEYVALFGDTRIYGGDAPSRPMANARWDVVCSCSGNCQNEAKSFEYHPCNGKPPIA